MGLSDGGVVCCTDRWVSSQGSHEKNPLDPEAAGVGAGLVPDDTVDVSPPVQAGHLDCLLLLLT